MDIASLVRREPIVPFAPGTRIPWDDPAFSDRMLREHLDPSHDRASRRTGIIDRQVEWLDAAVLERKPARILDLGCGPGLYTSRLAARGHACVGIDFSPASISYARDEATRSGLDCVYHLADLLEADLGRGFDAVTLWFGEFNTLDPDRVPGLLSRIADALSPGGRVVLEPHTADYVRGLGELPPFWMTSERGLFGDAPHLVLRENHWHESHQATTERFFVFRQSGAPDRYALSTRAYTDEAFAQLAAGAGLRIDAQYESLTGASEQDADLLGLVLVREG